jgi:hypothetical protein
MNILFFNESFMIETIYRYIGPEYEQEDAFVEEPPMQVKSFSTEHYEEQPSPFIMLPSSHSTVIRIPSPQISLQTPFDK